MNNLLTRKNQLWLLILLSAATMTIPYYIQGALSGGKAPSDIGATVWLFDHRAWAIRAIVEGLVIGYIARTNATGKMQTAMLWTLEIALIGLIAITLGPTLYASLNGAKLSTALAPAMQWGWSFALACYMPLMVLGASYAYKVQPDDALVDYDALAEVQTMRNELNERNVELASALNDVNRLHSDFLKVQMDAEVAQSNVDAMRTVCNTIDAWKLLNATAKARWIAEHTNGDRPAAAELALALGCAVTTVSRAYKSVDELGTQVPKGE